MKHASENWSQEVLAGLVERVTYHNVENGFCVLRAKARGHRDVVTVVGHAATIAAGEKVFDIIEATPDRLREVDGMGPVRASRITAAWAEQKAVREIMVFLHSHGVTRVRKVNFGLDIDQ